MPEPKPAENPPKAPATAQPGAIVDPYRAYNFKLLIDGVTEGHFTHCSGISARVEALRYREGGGGPVVHRLPGPVEYGDVTLRYGLTSSKELWTWFMGALNGQVQRKNVSVVMLGPDGTTEALRWNLLDAWPAEWRGAHLDALGNEIAIESITLVFESLNRE